MRLNDEAIRKVIALAKKGTIGVVDPNIDTHTASVDIHTQLAIDRGAVFVFPKSLYRELADHLSPDGRHKPVPVDVLKVPYSEMFLLEVDDITGRPTAAVTVKDEGVAYGGISVASRNVSRVQYTYNNHTQLVLGDEFVTAGRFDKTCRYGTVALTAVISLLQSKYADIAVVESQPTAHPGKYGKKKREAAKNLFAGTYTTVRPKEYAQITQNHTGKVLAAHWVRGHFKTRKTGIFWWQPHIAGSGPTQHRTAYILSK